MRVDQSNLMEITKSDSKVEIKGKVTVLTQETTKSQVEEATGKVHSVQQTSVDKPFFSADSQLEKIQQEAENMETQRYKENMEIVSNTATSADCAKLEEDGFSLNSTEVKTVVTEMDKIKMELAKAGVDISIFGDNLSLDQLQEMNPGAGNAYHMQRRLEEADLPATKENLAECQETMKEAERLTTCHEDTIKYMVDNELSPTVENLYKAQHSTGYGSISCENASKITMDASLQKQVEEVITQAGLSVNEKTLNFGKWMMQNEIPLTKENVQYVSDLSKMQFPLDSEQVMSAMIQAVQEGKRPFDAIVLPGYSLLDRAAHGADVIAKATEETVDWVVDKGAELTITNLEAGQNLASMQQKESTFDSKAGQNLKSTEAVPENIKYITAKRQLEEVRLLMTTQANYALLKQGISIETKPLEELVAQLKELENGYYKNLLTQNGIAPTKENSSLFAETLGKTQALKSAPAYLLGVGDIGSNTVNTLCENGAEWKARLDHAGEVYETLMTRPNEELGDSLTKAFQNIDDILKDLNLDTTQVNQRAVRILSYNQLPITEDSIAQIKGADQKVQVLFQKLSPNVVMEMIREGINPLELDVAQLSAKAEMLKQEQEGGGEEKFSKYLWKLEQKSQVSTQERDQFIGVYRLLNQINKTDGAVIGALVNQGIPLSMKNLMSAVKTNSKLGMNVTVSDDAISQNIASISKKDLSKTQQQQMSYQTDCAKEAFGILTPEGAGEVIGEKMLELTPEQLLWQLKNSKTDASLEETYYRQQLKEFSMAREAESEVLQMLTGHDMPVTAYNVLAANQMLQNRNGVFKTLFEGEKSTDLKEAKEKILEEFSEAVKTPEEMAKAQKKLADIAENVMKTMENSETVQSLDVRDLKILRQEIELGSRMAKEENYAIPVLVADELTNVQLKIVRGTKERGRVDVIFDCPTLGKVVAKFQVQGMKVKGYIASDSKEMVQQLKEQSEVLQENLSMDGALFPNLNIIQSEGLNLMRFSSDNGTYGEIAEQDQAEYQVQTKTLYGIAKAFLNTVKQLEASAA
ncbi:MAG: DUF6240 domain-containing protein [Lachnospiraceae bacterium]